MKVINFGLVSLLALSIFSCNMNNPNHKVTEQNLANEKAISTKIDPAEAVKIIQLEKATKDSNEVFTAQISEKGADIYFKIETPNNSFETKASTNGTPAKVAADVDQYLVYLVKNASATTYPLNGDPLGTTDLVSGPYTITNTGTGTPTSKTVRFTGVPSSGSDRYFVAVRAQETGPVVDLIKDNNGSGTAWTGDTASTPKVAVSTSGVSVSAALVVNPTANLVVTPQLEDGTGATIEATITPNAGSLDSLNAVGI